ncbi:hypothetical protein [Paenisporosarcina cavernae]|nr:hypothetical protein [Paenisporosarcina cavernae]AYC28664.1 hypothetical protein D3873_01795 [Paenisporosarcina cavernae]
MSTNYKRYDFTTKKIAVERYLSGESAQSVAVELEISNRRRVQDWAELVRTAGSFEVLHGKQGKKPKTQREKLYVLEIEKLKREIAVLKKRMDSVGR